MLHRTTLALALLACLAPSLAAEARHCNGIITEVSDGVNTYYIEARPDDLYQTLWIYVESNGVVGLQSGGPCPGGYSDPCRHTPHDTCIF